MNYITKIEIIKGREWVKRAMYATQGKFCKATKLTDKTFLRLLVARHSVIEEFEIWVDAIVPERVHTHIVRHKEIGKYVSTSRPDISNSHPIENGMRKLSLRINAKRLLEIMDQRLCNKAWKETISLLTEICNAMNQIDSSLYKAVTIPCVRFGYCPETNRTCGWIYSESFKKQREEWLELINSLM